MTDNITPVAWRYRYNGQWYLSQSKTFAMNGLDLQPLYASPQPARETGVLIAALEYITKLSRALRQGGPDLMDLQDLSDALNEAVDTAAAALRAGEQP